MKAVCSLLALATTSLASVIVPRGGGGYGSGGGDVTKTMTTYVTTSVCPTTKTYTKPGTTYCETDYVTSTMTITECGNCEVTVTAPDVVVTETAVDYTYLTSYCPYTETKTVNGKTETAIWTQTQVIKTTIAKPVTVYTSYVTTVRVSTDVYTTVTCPVEVYTTVVKGSTVELTNTYTKVITVKEEKTVTEVIPVTKTKSVDVTVPVTVGSVETITSNQIVYVTISGTVYQTTVQHPQTVTQVVSSTTSAIITKGTTLTGPTTTVPAAQSTTTAPVVVTGAADANNPGLALAAGLFALFALV